MPNTASLERLDHIKPKAAFRQRTEPVILHTADISHYLMELKQTGRTQGTVDKYRNNLTRFREFLGAAGCIYPDSLIRWRQSMIQDGYAPRTVNSSLVAVNGLYNYLGCQEWKLFDWIELEDTESLELTREEYHWLLEEARRQRNIQLYLIIKTLACTDLTPSDLIFLTREALDEGQAIGRMRGAKREIPLPGFLREALLEYAVSQSIHTGPIFLNGNRNPHNRFVIAKQIAALGEEAGLEPGKANARNLRRVYLSILEELKSQAEQWVQNTYWQLLNAEEERVGWRT